MASRTNRVHRLRRRPAGDLRSGDLELVEEPVPEPADGQALVRVLLLSLEPDEPHLDERGARLHAAGADRRRHGGRDRRGRGVAARRPAGRGDRQRVHRLAGLRGRRRPLPPSPCSPTRCRGRSRRSSGCSATPGSPRGSGSRCSAGRRRGRPSWCPPPRVPSDRSRASSPRHAAHGSSASPAGRRSAATWSRTSGSTPAWTTVPPTGASSSTPRRPEGVDVDFENVGGEIMDHVLGRLNAGRGRAVRDDLPSTTRRRPARARPAQLHQLIMQRATIRGFLVLDHVDRSGEASAGSPACSPRAG